jgi:hypothetical protein
VVDRRLLTFFASPKKVSKERRRKAAALRVPEKVNGKAGNETNSLRSDMFRFLSALPFTFSAASHAGQVKTSATTASYLEWQIDMSTSFALAAICGINWLTCFLLRV